jgi:hypothetical protein
MTPTLKDGCMEDPEMVNLGGGPGELNDREKGVRGEKAKGKLSLCSQIFAFFPLAPEKWETLVPAPPSLPYFKNSNFTTPSHLTGKLHISAIKTHGIGLTYGRF